MASSAFLSTCPQCISFASVLQANFGCHWFKFMPEIPAFAQWTTQSLHMKFEQTSCSWTGSWSRSAALKKYIGCLFPKITKHLNFFDSTEPVLQVNAQSPVAALFTKVQTLLQRLLPVAITKLKTPCVCALPFCQVSDLPRLCQSTGPRARPLILHSKIQLHSKFWNTDSLWG